MKSIRGYLLTRLVGGAAVTLALAGWGVHLVVLRELEAQFDRNFDDSLRGLSSLLFQVRDEVQFEFSDELMPEYSAELSPSYFELIRADGAVLERSQSLGGRPLVTRPDFRRDGGCRDEVLPDGRAGRVCARWVEVHHVYPEEGPDRPTAARVFIAVARGRESLDRSEQRALAACAALTAILTALLSGVAWFAVARGLAPARRLALRLDQIDVSNLPREVAFGELPTELAPVAEKTRSLVRRVDQALSRERRTSADIAHELRTPISELITVADVALRAPERSGHMRAALLTTRDIAWRLGACVSTLLELARIEMGGATLAGVRFDLAELLEGGLVAIRDRARERRLSVETRISGPAWACCGRDALSIVLGNLLSNAAHYSPVGGKLLVALELQSDVWRVRIENAAPRLGQEDLELLSQPFWRKDRARSDRERIGLGLALARALADAMGVRMTFSLEDGRLCAELLVPAAERGSELAPRRTVIGAGRSTDEA